MRVFFTGLAGKRLLLPVFLLFLTGMVFAVPPLELKLPVFIGDSHIVGQINQAMENFFIDYKNEIDTKLGYLPENVNNLARGFANASVFSSDGASQRGYEGYKAFAFTFGFMDALQLPKLSLFSDITDAIGSDEEIESEFIKDFMNIPFGFDFQMLNAQLGINTSKFLLKDLYLGFKLSMFDTNWINAIAMNFPGLSFRTMSLGINASYQLITQKRLPMGLLVWRGLNLGVGFIYQKTSLELKSDSILGDLIGEGLKNISVPVSLPTIEDYYIDMQVDGSLRMDFDTKVYIIPVNAVTSLRLFGFLNVALGAGCDIGVGRSDIKVDAFLTVDKNRVNNRLVLDDISVEMLEAPSLTFNLPGKSGPSSFNPKIMGAVGFNFGPIVIDIPLTYYFKNNGYSFGVTFGLTF
jgi:hypothetical protein